MRPGDFGQGQSIQRRSVCEYFATARTAKYEDIWSKHAYVRVRTHLFKRADDLDIINSEATEAAAAAKRQQYWPPTQAKLRYFIWSHECFIIVVISLCITFVMCYNLRPRFFCILRRSVLRLCSYTHKAFIISWREHSNFRKKWNRCSSTIWKGNVKLTWHNNMMYCRQSNPYAGRPAARPAPFLFNRMLLGVLTASWQVDTSLFLELHWCYGCCYNSRPAPPIHVILPILPSLLTRHCMGRRTDGNRDKITSGLTAK